MAQFFFIFFFYIYFTDYNCGVFGDFGGCFLVGWFYQEKRIGGDGIVIDLTKSLPE